MVMDQELTIPSWHMIEEEPLRRIKSAPMQREKARRGVEMRAGEWIVGSKFDHRMEF
jgi:hypothetical protein